MIDKKPFEEIMEILEKHSEAIEGIQGVNITSRIKGILSNIDILNSFKIKVGLGNIPYSGSTYLKISEEQHLSLMGEDQNRTISWSDNGEQPKGEWLYCLKFSTGAYFLHSEYPTETFIKFFNELKSYGPEYCDTRNHCLYFTKDNAATVHNSLQGIYKKYRELAVQEAKEAKIKKLEASLDNLKSA